LYFAHSIITIIIPWNASKAVNNQLKCQPSGVVEFCSKEGKNGGNYLVMHECQAVYCTRVMKLFAHAETILERSTRVG